MITCPIPQQICIYVSIIYIQKIKVSWIMPEEAKKFKLKLSIQIDHVMHKLRHQFLHLNQNKLKDIWCGQVCAKFHGYLKIKFISWILWRYICICIDGHYVKIYGYYETDANRDQARFSRRWVFGIRQLLQNDWLSYMFEHRLYILVCRALTSPKIACWISNHWVAGTNTLGHVSSLLSPNCPQRLLGPV